MTRAVTDLAHQINPTAEVGNPANFPVTLKPVFYRTDGILSELANRLAVVREETREMR